MKNGALVHDSHKLEEPLQKKFSHLHYGALPPLKHIVQGLSDFKIQKPKMHKGCALGKHEKTAFPSS